ncbi:DEAD/DEAH box helicase family protein [Selenomonas sp.]|uniref:DEAD/DEAH box helicase family protein n=1 Tax=Selenomonas sp. TaxID=2053611 RepID=UPI0025CFA7EE|nr:DEAD/DEAH box helicase family protein [Selenomonas sp.]MBQ1867783.1 DEAD/DEAH box helicase family protein [Selenomonas sp.]
MMGSNFDFMNQEPKWKHIADRIKKAEQGLSLAPETTAIFCRSALELGIKWVYIQEGLSIADPFKAGRDKELHTLLHSYEFKNVVDNPTLCAMLDRVRRIGNAAAHGESISRSDAILVLRIMFNFFQWMAYCYSDAPTDLQFDDTLLPVEGVDAQQSEKQLANLNAKLCQQDEALSKKEQELVKARADMAEMQRQMQELRKARQQEQSFKVDEITEAETRRRFIDWDLREAGWSIGGNCAIEEAVIDMPNAQGVGFADYILYGADRRPLAIIEAKRTSYSVEKGREQAKLYADSKEREFGRRPFIFLTNGYEIYFLDDASGYDKRRVSGFFSPEDLADRMYQRENRKPMTSVQANPEIAGRPYQLQAIRAVQEAADGMRRRFLLVLATGTGKTRISISLSDLFMVTGWAKRILFLADRTALVTQAMEKYQEFFKERASLANLLEHPEQATTARIVFSTYPTMMNAIDEARGKDGLRKFSPAHFDLIVIDESHRSIYQRYQAIFAYFDAMLLGLTATPKSDVDKNTYRQFHLDNGVPTFEYDFDSAVKQEYLVPFELLNRTTKRLREGIKYKELSEEDKAQMELEMGLEGEEIPDVKNSEINKYFFIRETVEKVLDDLMESGLKIEGGDKLGKTIIFARNRKHAEYIVQVFHERYPEYKEDFIKQVDGSVDYHDHIIKEFTMPNKAPQIAVSVDMLDTGIDVPELVNLVFFKTVHSFSKFWQMIGRGTRLCPDLYGPGQDKDGFRIFDYGGNFEYFEVHGNKGSNDKLQTPISERLFNVQVNVYHLLRLQNDPEEKDFVAELREKILTAVKNLNQDSFRVQQQREYVMRYSEAQTWDVLTEQNVQEIKAHIAQLMTTVDEDESARRFDLLLYSMMLDTLESKDIERKANMVRETAERLSADTLQSISLVQVHADFIKRVRQPEFWEQVTIHKLEQTRKELRDLIRLLTKSKSPIYTVDISDELIELPGVHETPAQYASEAYEKKVTRYLQDHKDNLAVYKLRNNKRLTSTDLKELERILWQELGTEHDYEETYGNLPVGQMVRRIVGMERGAVEEAFAEFLQANRLNSNQMDFVQRIIDYIAQNGVMEREDLLNPIFDSCGDLMDIFAGQETEISKILERVDMVKNNSIEIA